MEYPSKFLKLALKRKPYLMLDSSDSAIVRFVGNLHVSGLLLRKLWCK